MDRSTISSACTEAVVLEETTQRDNGQTHLVRKRDENAVVLELACHRGRWPELVGIGSEHEGEKGIAASE